MADASKVIHRPASAGFGARQSPEIFAASAVTSFGAW